MKHTAHLDNNLGYFEELQPNNSEEMAANIRRVFLEPRLLQDIKVSVPGRCNLASTLYYGLLRRDFERGRQAKSLSIGY